MADFPFTDKYGRIVYHEVQTAAVREQNYLIVRKGNTIMCGQSTADGVWHLPSANEVETDAEPTAEFSSIAYIWENDAPIKEIQTYTVYLVADADLENTEFSWCLINDILVGKVGFDATQKIGIKNLLVRVKE